MKGRIFTKHRADVQFISYLLHVVLVELHQAYVAILRPSYFTLQ